MFSLKFVLLFLLSTVRLSFCREEVGKCPGLYCGRTQLSDGNYSACGACERGSRPDNMTLCQRCEDSPSFYDWLYLGFMALLAPILHSFFIDFTNKNKEWRYLLGLHVISFLESVASAVCTLLVVEPIGSFSVRSCRVQRLSDWYSMLFNPTPDYQNTIYCTQEIVFPLYTMVMIYYAFCLLFMMTVRLIVSARFLEYRGTLSIYAALYFLPILVVLQAVFGGLVYYAFPSIIIIVSVVTNAIHFSLFPHQDLRSLFMANIKSSRNICIILLHWLLHAYGIIAFSDSYLQTTPHFALLVALVPIPSVFYLLTVKFTDPDKIEFTNVALNQNI